MTNYNNPLNRRLAHELYKISEKYIHHTERMYDMPVAESTIGNARKNLVNDSNINRERTALIEKEGNYDYDSLDSENDLEPNHIESEDLQGGAYGSKGGYAQGTFRDSGYSPTLGVKGSGYHNNENKFEGGYAITPFISALKRKSKKANPLNILSTVADVASNIPIPVVSNVASVIKTGTDLLQSVMHDKEEGKGKRKHAPKSKKAKSTNPKLKEEKELLLKRIMDGGSNKTPNKSDVGIISGGKKRRGRPSKMSGGTDLARPYNMVNKDGITGSGKKLGRVIGGHKLTPVAQMHSSGMSGQGNNKTRSEIVKEVMKNRGVGMIEASKIVKQEGLYKK